MLIFGVQKVRPWYTLTLSFVSRYFTRASSLAAVKTSSIRRSSKLDAMPIGCGNTVALPLRAMPCRASLHQLYCLMPRRGMAGLACIVREAFSSRVRRLSRSAARRSGERLLS